MNALMILPLLLLLPLIIVIELGRGVVRLARHLRRRLRRDVLPARVFVVYRDRRRWREFMNGVVAPLLPPGVTLVESYRAPRLPPRSQKPCIAIARGDDVKVVPLGTVLGNMRKAWQAGKLPEPAPLERVLVAALDAAAPVERRLSVSVTTSFAVPS